MHRAISRHYDSGNFELCESLCQKQMQINEFDETAYKYLMQIYLSRKEYTQALHIYNCLESLLEQELFETPAKEIQDLALAIEQTWNEEVNKILEGKRTEIPQTYFLCLLWKGSRTGAYGKEPVLSRSG
ncbi:hypothetical protein LC724_31235 [Blautia sp. RD014234]|nr:hypothetical protein [Blautia parvula]